MEVTIDGDGGGEVGEIVVGMEVGTKGRGEGQG